MKRPIQVLKVLSLVFLLVLNIVPEHTAASGSISIVAPGAGGVILPELDEFATVVLGDPWDMNEPTDLAFYRAESQIANSQFLNGVYTGQMTSGAGGERITLLTMGAADNTALRTGKIGYNYPIDTDHYRYLTFRMYSSNTACNSGLVQWFADDSYTNAVMGITNGFLVPPSPCINRPAGWYIYTLDLETIGIQLGGQDWDGLIRELILHPFAGTGAAGATVKLDWARLTAENPNTARPFTIRWNADGTGGPITLYASPGDKVLDADDLVIATAQSESGGTYVFQTGVLPAGDYYIAAQNSTGIVWSEGPLTINAMPKAAITKPSMTSGQEYAATEIGDAWDMNDPDLNGSEVVPPLYTCVIAEQYADGIYSAVVPSPICPSGWWSDPILYLGGMDRYPAGTLDPVVDTAKYRYLSYRFHHSGLQDVEHGWVARFGWWQVNATDNGINEQPVMSRDIIILEGWNTYKIDLWAADIVDEAHPVQVAWKDSHPNRLRFDPSEATAELVPVTIQLDWIKLTAMDEVVQGQVFPIQYLLNDNQATVTVYYDVDTNPNNGRMLAKEVTGLPPVSLPPTMTQRIYLPLVGRNIGSTDLIFQWDTTGVTPGEYWVSIVVDDGYNIATWYSEAPLLVKSPN